jgi:DNA invertase Pin-like site-specific DNA recombinase
MEKSPVFSLGYARVSDDDQNLDIQLAMLAKAGCAGVFCEKVSGWGKELPELKKAIAALPHGGFLIVRNIDRLGRSMTETLRNVVAIHDRGAFLRSIEEPYADTSAEFGGMFVAFLGSMAEKERKTMLSRTTAGQRQAKANGKQLGRPHKLSAVQKGEAVRRFRAGENYTTIAAVVGASRHTVRRFLLTEAAREQIAGQPALPITRTVERGL